MKKFAVVFFDVQCHFWKDGYAVNSPENVKQLTQYCYTLGLEGATDLHGALREVAETKWLTENGSRPDLFLLSDGAANWGETNLRLIKREIDSANVGSIFAYQTGLMGTAIRNLQFLASETGGAVFSVAGQDEIARASTAHRNRPWRLEKIEIDGATDVMTAGRTQWVYPGQWLTIVGRGGAARSNIALQLRRGETQKTLAIMPTAEIQSDLASRLYGQVAVGQLEDLGHQVLDVAAAYARHFRITGQTCSLLMLESEADYQRFDIKPKEDWFVVKSKNASRVVESMLETSAAKLSDPKSQLVDWIKRLESIQGMNFTMPTALSIALEDMDVVAIDGRLKCTDRSRDTWSKPYFKTLSGKINYDVITTEAAERGKESADDAIRVLSNLIERNPGDWVLARDVAYSAIQLNRPAAAYHLLRNVAVGRPFEGSTYLALGHCLTQLGQADMAMIYYEIALAGSFQNQGGDYDQIVSTEYRSLLRRIVKGDFKTAARSFADARLESLHQNVRPESDLVITMMWNTDETDVDLHVTEPTGETCSYQNKQTRSGGKITSDITNGFGPEMYWLPNAPDGKFEISAKYYGGNQNRTSVPCKVYLTIYRDYGTTNEMVTRETVRLAKVGDKQMLKEIKFGNGK